ncbi:calponin homology domain-containing protein DDB_G0272472-like [Mercenaria mercenaria]|uniref:calponin homology domain-containing protein DDB_G0272472-like n=1 Tax=Mercenaria mercenaria TaxID=6596 RepID=UPI00234F6346|nr:calponin homology domain-containing protein DDB_G0272472-like [Mercenaria mercenaria]
MSGTRFDLLKQKEDRHYHFTIGIKGGESVGGYPAPPGSHIGQQGRSVTWHAFSKDTGSELSRQAVKSEPTRIRPTYPFPSLHLIQGGESADELDEEYAYADRTKEKLVWVDALNKWVPQRQLHPRPYMSFVGNAPVLEKHSRLPKEIDGGGQHDGVQTCERFEMHMGQRTSVSQPQDKSKQRNNEKREAIRKRAQELAEQKKQRKAYSTPLYTSITERKQNLKPREQSSRTHSSLPVSPVHHKEKVPSPKQVWQAEESPKLQRVQEKKPQQVSPMKKEISITLVSPQPEDEVKDEDEDRDKVSEKKVTFIDEGKTTAKSSKKKKDEEDSESSKSAEEEMKLEEQRLIESLEKQRQIQIQEQQKLLAEQQQKEKERKEKERLAEEERLRKMKESNNMQKQPLSTQNQNHDNYYENTMNAAGKRRKGKGKVQPKPTKVDKSPPKKPVIKKIEEEKPSENVVNSVKYVKPTKPVVTAETESKPKPKVTDNKSKARDNLVKKLRTENLQEHIPKVVPKPKPDPPSKPMLAGIGAQQKPVTAVPQGTKPEKKEEKLPVTKPIKEEEIIKPRSPASERRKSIIEQREIVKKERRDGRKCSKLVEEPKQLDELEVDVKKVESWIYEKVDFLEKKELEKEEVHIETEPLPSLFADLNPELIEKEKEKFERKEKRRKFVLANLLSNDKAVRKWRKPGKVDSSYADELRRLELAEERRKRQMEMFERLKNRRLSPVNAAFDDGTPRFEDCEIRSRPESGGFSLDFDDGFLAKYCIFTKGNIEMYRHAFDAVDEAKTGWLEGEDVMIALRGVNNKLTEAEEEYLYRVLELTGYKLTHGADFKIFSVLAALSQRISALDKWMKNLIGQMDFKALEMKMFKCKTLWECNVDKETNSISIDQLCVDLRAGGVSWEHEMEVREKLAHLHALDLLDFLTYIPLFIMIHEAVVKNPLDNTRNK